MLTPELKNFGAKLAPLALNEAALAVALVWYLSHVDDAPEVSSAKLAKLMHDLALRGQVNTSRLASRLAQHGDLVRGKKAANFRIRLSELDRLTQQFGPLLERPKPKVDEHIVLREEFAASTRKYILAMIDQINGCYQFGFYDGCAVMCRRLMETLLIEAFEHAGGSNRIKSTSGDYMGLSEIIARARAGQTIKLQRGSADVMDEIKQLGDTAAHSRMYITKQPDVDQVRFKYRKVISELANLADLA